MGEEHDYSVNCSRWGYVDVLQGAFLLTGNFTSPSLVVNNGMVQKGYNDWDLFIQS